MTPVRFSRRQSLLFGSAALALGAHQADARPYVPARGKGVQDNWRFCSKCFTMFYGGGNGGVCPAGGPHAAQGFNFGLYFDDIEAQPTPGRDSQFDWRFCEKCYGLFYSGALIAQGACPVNSPDTGASAHKHWARGYFFGLPHDNPGNPGQPDWRFCYKCFGLFFDDPNNPNKGRCPGGGAHDMASNSFNFQIAHDGDWAGPQPDNTTANFGFPPAPGSMSDGPYLSGQARLVVRSNGDFTFTCHAHDSGPDPIHYAISAVLLSASGIAFTFLQGGHLEGTTSSLTPNRNDNPISTGNNPLLAQEFAGIQKGATFKARIVGTDKLVAGVKGTMSDVIDDAAKSAKAVGAIVVTTVVTVLVNGVLNPKSSSTSPSNSSGSQVPTAGGSTASDGTPPSGAGN